MMVSAVSSVSTMLVNVTLPVFVIVNEYVTVPGAETTVGSAVLTNVNAGACANVWVSSSVSVTSSPIGGVPVAVAMFVNVPASMSPCVRVYVAVNVVESMAPGAIVAIGPPVTVTNGSVTVTLVRVTLPVFSTVNV